MRCRYSLEVPSPGCAAMPESVRSPRVNRVVDVTLKDGDDYPLMVRPSKTVNLSRTGLLMQVPLHLDAATGEEVVVRLRWRGGHFESAGLIVRFESPYLGDASTRVMGIRLVREVPDVLLSPSASGSVEVVDSGHAA